MTAAALAVYAAALAAAAAAVWRRPLVALPVFVVGLALHNLAAALLWGAGVRGAALAAILAWKEILLATALASVAVRAARERRLPFRPGAVDALALAFAAFVVAYALLPQDALGGTATARGVAYSLRHYLVPVAAYLLGRSALAGARDVRRVAWLVVGVSAAVAAGGLLDGYLVPLAWWKEHSGAVGYFRVQLGLAYRVPGGLPENFVFTTAEGPVRRLVSSFLSPLASAYLAVVALLAVAARPRRSALAAGVLVGAGLLWTNSRAAVLGLGVGLLALALLRRSPWPAVAAVAAVGGGLAFSAAFGEIAPRTHYFPEDRAFLVRNAREHGDVPGGATSLSTAEPSLRGHWQALKDGLDTVVHHPQGFGLGNAGTSASREGTRVRAGESNYTEIGVETGIGGLAAFVAWSLALLLGLARSRAPGAAWAAAALAASLAIAVQTDLLGVPWLAYCLWWLAGSAVTAAAPATVPAASGSGRRSGRARGRTATARP